MDSLRDVDIKYVEAAKNNLDKLILWVLRTRGPSGRHEIVQHIFSSHGFLPHQEKVDQMLDLFLQKSIIEKRPNGLTSVFTLTNHGLKMASDSRESIDIL